MSARFLAPAFRVEVNGSRLEADVSRHVLAVSATGEPGVPARCELTLANPFPELPWTHTDRERLFAEGNAVRVWMGYGDDLASVFDGEITGASPSFPESGAPTVQVSAHDRLHRLQTVRRHRTLRDGTYAQLVRTIAQDAGLEARVDDTGPTHPYLLQSERTDFDFLTALARVIRFELWVEGRTLHFRRPAGEQAPRITLAWGPAASTQVLPLRSFSPSLDARQQVTAVVVRGLDPVTRKVIEGRAGAGAEDRMGGRETGPQVAARAFGGGQPLLVTGEPVASQAEAEQRAKAILNERAMQFIRGSGHTIGLPELRAGTTVRIEGVGTRFSGSYLVTRATHRIDGGGFSTTFDARRNAGRMTLLDLLDPRDDAPSGRIYGVVTGVVTNNQDPEKLGRVRLRFPWLSDEDESAWARVSAPMAGKQAGAWFLPEVDDEVLVVFERGDPRFPYVLGALWSADVAPPETNEDGKNDRRMLRSRSGHVVRLDDRDGEERIEIVDGSGKASITMSTKDGSVTIASDGDLTLRAANGKVVVEGNGIEVRSQAAVAVEAGANLELKASGQATVKGATINLN